MKRIRLSFVVLGAVLATIGLFGGGAIAFASAHECTDPALDNDTEYAGDVDTWCGTNPVLTPVSDPTSLATQPSPTAQPTTTPPPPAAPGAFPVAFFAPDFSGPATRQFSQQFITQSGTYLETTYPAGSSAPSSGHPGGAQAQLKLAKGPVDDATLTYQVRFPVGTQFVKGGKLPGLCGGACWTGSNNGPGGWATRYMWRTAGEGEVLLSDATTTGYGTDLGRGTGAWSFRADGLWHTISQHVHMNTPGVADGYIDVTYDGVAVAHFAGITFRAATDTNLHIDSIMFCTFYGGHDSTWAPTVDQHFDFSSFHVTTA